MVEKIKGRWARLVATLAAMLGVGVVLAGSASAAVDPAVTSGVTGGFDDAKTLITGTLIPALMGLVVIGIAVAVAVKYLKRGSSKA